MSEHATPMELDTYYLVLLHAGDSAHDFTEDELMDLQVEHLSHIQKLAREGKLIIAGPFIDAPDDLRGLFILKAGSIEEAQTFVDDDPAVQAGRLKMQVITWCVQKGALNPLIEKIQADLRESNA